MNEFTPIAETTKAKFSLGISQRTVLSVLAIAIVCALPFLVKNYRVAQFSQLLIYAVAILGLAILTGYSGQISLGHGAFYAVGAYVVAILIDKTDMPYWATVPLAGLVCVVIGFLIGFPALRLEGHYLALATYALALAMPQLLKYKGLEDWTGGAQGLILTKPEAPFELTLFGNALGSDRWLFFINLVVAVVMFVLASNLLRGRFGRGLIAVRDHPIAAVAMGVNKSLYKSLAFAISAGYTGVAGALAALSVGFVAPDSFTVFLSISLLVGAVVGGLTSLSGAVLGAVFILFVPNWSQDLSTSAPWAIYGVLLLAVMYLAPTGLTELIKRGYRRVCHRHRREPADAPSPFSNHKQE